VQDVRELRAIRDDIGGGANVSSLVTLFGNYGGQAIAIMGGAFAGQVEYAGNGSQTHLTAFLGAGNDNLTLDAGSILASLYADFGPGTDTFTDNVTITWPTTLKNLS